MPAVATMAARVVSQARSGGARRTETEAPGRELPASATLTPVSGRLDPRVDGYISKLPEWQQAICRRVRDLIHEADPEIDETIKRTIQPYFVLDGNVAALLATKDHVN